MHNYAWIEVTCSGFMVVQITVVPALNISVLITGRDSKVNQELMKTQETASNYLHGQKPRTSTNLKLLHKLLHKLLYKLSIFKNFILH